MLLTTTITRLAESRSCDHLNRIGKTQVRTLLTLGVGGIQKKFFFCVVDVVVLPPQYCSRCRVAAAVGITSGKDL